MTAPMTYSATGVLFENDVEPASREVKPTKSVEKFVPQIVWRNVGYLMYFHLASLYGLYLLFTSAKLATFLFCK